MWALIIFVLSSSGVAVTTQEFVSQDLCASAKDDLPKGNAFVGIKAECVKTGK